MLRVLLTVVLPLGVPTAVYLLWLRLRRAAETAHGAEAAETLQWGALPWVWLAGAGAILLAVVLFVVTVHFGTSQPGIYVPPHRQGDHIVPGHIEPSNGPSGSP
jgi:hypothetical protein